MTDFGIFTNYNLQNNMESIARSLSDTIRAVLDKLHEEFRKMDAWATKNKEEVGLRETRMKLSAIFNKLSKGDVNGAKAIAMQIINSPQFAQLPDGLQQLLKNDIAKLHGHKGGPKAVKKGDGDNPEDESADNTTINGTNIKNGPGVIA